MSNPFRKKQRTELKVVSAPRVDLAPEILKQKRKMHAFLLNLIQVSVAVLCVLVLVFAGILAGGVFAGTQARDLQKKELSLKQNADKLAWVEKFYAEYSDKQAILEEELSKTVNFEKVIAEVNSKIPQGETIDRFTTSSNTCTGANPFLPTQEDAIGCVDISVAGDKGSEFLSNLNELKDVSDVFLKRENENSYSLSFNYTTGASSLRYKEFLTKLGESDAGN
jgi:hypothetical protein